MLCRSKTVSEVANKAGIPELQKSGLPGQQ
jgi:hypothetical protein